jgi:roadblock/LC7 domain-containing protein
MVILRLIPQRTIDLTSAPLQHSLFLEVTTARQHIEFPPCRDFALIFMRSARGKCAERRGKCVELRRQMCGATMQMCGATRQMCGAYDANVRSSRGKCVELTRQMCGATMQMCGARDANVWSSRGKCVERRGKCAEFTMQMCGAHEANVRSDRSNVGSHLGTRLRVLDVPLREGYRPIHGRDY